MAININELKELIIPKSIATPDKGGSQPGWGAYGVGYNIYDLVEAIIVDLEVGTSTLVSGNLVDNLNGSYTWTPIVGAVVTVNTHASTNPIFNIPGLVGATTTQEALEALYTAITLGGSFPHPAVSIGGGSNSALDVDLVTQVATLDLNAIGSFDTLTAFGGVSSLNDWFVAMESLLDAINTSIGVSGALHMGTFTGSIISDNVTIKVALQELEDAVTIGATGSTSVYTDNLDGTYTLDNGSVLSPSTLIIDLQAVNLPLTTNIVIGASTATTVQGALDLFKLCCDGLEPVLGTGVTVAGGFTTTLAGAGFLPILFDAQSGFDLLELAINDRKPITTSVLTNPALTIDTLAPSLDKIILDLTAVGSYDNTGNTNLTSDNIQGVIDQIDTELDRIGTDLMGLLVGAINFGSFAGVTIASNITLKAILQELETALEAITPNIPILTDNLDGTYTHDDGTGNTEIIDTTAATSPITVIGIVAINTEDAVAELLANQLIIQTALGSVTTHMGTFTGTTIPDSLSVKQALQVLETEIESFSAAPYISEVIDNLDNTYTHSDGAPIPTVVVIDVRDSVIAYDNVISGLTATNVHDALDELQVNIESLYNGTIENIVFVSSLADLPAPIVGVINLVNYYTYIFTTDVDLVGNRIQCGINNVVQGTSFENASVTSTGLGIGIPLISGLYTVELKNIKIKDINTCFNLDGLGNTMVLYWTEVSLENVTKIGYIDNFSNFIFTKGVVSNSQELLFGGTFDTVAFESSILSGDNIASPYIIGVDAGAICNKRVRFINTSIDVPALATGISIPLLTTIPNESYILDNVFFSGAGTYLDGSDYTSDSASFFKCSGITNTAISGQVYMTANATATTIAVLNTFYKIAGTTTASADNSKVITSTTNRIEIDASVSKKYRLDCTLSFETSADNVCTFGFYDSISAAVRTPSRTKGTANGAGKAENIYLFDYVNAEQLDYFEVHCSNNTATNNITVTNINFSVTAL